MRRLIETSYTIAKGDKSVFFIKTVAPGDSDNLWSLLMNENLTDWYAKLSEQLQALGFQAETFYSHSLLPLQGFIKESSNANAKCVYVTSGVHGDEPAGPMAIQRLAEEHFFNDEVTWLVSPLLNPDGFIHYTRENRKGIDLNRDF